MEKNYGIHTWKKQGNGAMIISKEVLEIIACPKCKQSIEYDRKNQKLVCKKCRLRYSIIENKIPNMIINEAERF